MEIIQLPNQPVTTFRFLNAGRKPNNYFVDQIPVHWGQVDQLPDELDALVLTADLQGRECFEDRQHAGPIRLMGEVLHQRLESVLEDLGQLSFDKTGIVLAGDFYTYPDLRGRGGSGDVTSVWQSLANHFKWVVGVAGNHDKFGENTRPPNWGNIHFLDGQRKQVSGIQFAGLSGIIGNPQKNFRRERDDYLEVLESIIRDPTEILVMHDGPDGGRPDCRGNPDIRQSIERFRPRLVVRGHCHWPIPLVDLCPQVQVINVDCRVVILTSG